MCFTLPVSANLKHTQEIWVSCYLMYHIFKKNGVYIQCVWEGRGVLHSKNVHLNVEFFPPSCGVLFAKRGGGGGGDGGVAV